MYFEDNGIAEFNVIRTLYAAEKYAVSELVDICQSFLETNMREDNVCVIIENARLFNISGLLKKCYNFIFGLGPVARKVFESNSFLDLKKESLSSFVKSDDLSLDKYFIYHSITRWAKHNCVKEGKNKPTVKQIRDMLGNLIFEVRFPTMSLEDFWKKLSSDEILSEKEKTHISKVIVGKTVEDVLFKSTDRTDRKRYVQLLRIRSDATSCVWRQGNRVDAIEFAVNHHISLNGILLYGNSNEKYRYDVEIKIISASDISLLHVLPTKIKASGNIFKIYFDRPCRISPHKKYTAWVKMTGS